MFTYKNFELLRTGTMSYSSYFKCAKKNEVILLLDENGDQYTSRQFLDMIFKQLKIGGSYITFVIGGASWTSTIS